MSVLSNRRGNFQYTLTQKGRKVIFECHKMDDMLRESECISISGSDMFSPWFLESVCLPEITSNKLYIPGTDKKYDHDLVYRTFESTSEAEAAFRAFSKLLQKVKVTQIFVSDVKYGGWDSSYTSSQRFFITSKGAKIGCQRIPWEDLIRMIEELLKPWGFKEYKRTIKWHTYSAISTFEEANKFLEAMDKAVDIAVQYFDLDIP